MERLFLFARAKEQALWTFQLSAEHPVACAIAAAFFILFHKLMLR